MIRFRTPSCRSRRLGLLPTLALASLGMAACDRALLDPALRDGDEAALLRAAGVARPEGRYTLAGMVLEAGRELARSDSGATARALLERFGRDHAALLADSLLGNAEALAAAREQLRQAELTMVGEVLGRPGAERAILGLTAALDMAGTALDSAAGRWPGDVALLRRRQQDIAGTLGVARARLDADDVTAALDAGTSAADELLELRRDITALDRVRALPELFLEAQRTLAAADGAFAGGSELLREHARLEDVARAAVAEGDRERAHAALTAVRESELRIALEVLGPRTAARVVADVGKALAELKAGAAKGAAGADPRLRRMHRAALDLHFRAARALRDGDGIAALDLASYAAGLVNAYRLASARY